MAGFADLVVARFQIQIPKVGACLSAMHTYAGCAGQFKHTTTQVCNANLRRHGFCSRSREKLSKSRCCSTSTALNSLFGPRSDLRQVLHVAGAWSRAPSVAFARRVIRFSHAAVPVVPCQFSTPMCTGATFRADRAAGSGDGRVANSIRETRRCRGVRAGRRAHAMGVSAAKSA